MNYIYLVVHNLNSIKSITNSFELNKNVILKTFESNVPLLFRETYIRFDYKQQETCSETFIRTFFFFENIKTEIISLARFLKYYIRVYQWQQK